MGELRNASSETRMHGLQQTTVEIDHVARISFTTGGERGSA